MVHLAVSLKSRHCGDTQHHFTKLRVLMSNVCQVTGRRPTTGFTVSHSHRRNKRWFKPNIQKKKFYVPNEKRHVTLTVSAKGIKIINKRGIESVLADLRRRGEKV